MTKGDLLALAANPFAQKWHDFWHGEIGGWILTRGLKIALLLIGGVLGARFINWLAGRISTRIDANFQESDALVRSESAKHRQAVYSVMSYLAIALLAALVAVEVIDTLAVPIGSLVAPAAVRSAPHWASVRNGWCRTCCPGSSSSPRSSTVSATWCS